MKSRFVLLSLIAPFILLAAPAACEEEQQSAIEKQPVVAETPREQFTDDYSLIENAYTRVVMYYNKNMPARQARKIARLVLYYSDRFGLDPRLLVAVIVVESRFQPDAVSPKGAMGLGQLMPDTARILGVNNAFDVSQNIYGTARYLRLQYDRWQHSENVLDLMLASYNAGPEAVARYKGVPPYRETKNYVIKVKRLYTFFVYGS